MRLEGFRRLELNGGRVLPQESETRFVLPAVTDGYADAQVDDYGMVAQKRPFLPRRHFPWQPGTRMRLRARFSHAADDLVGTAGFGFWNAPFADPTIKWPALPQAAWFFFASPPSDLPLATTGPGRGWFAATLDATSRRALAWAPLALPVLLLNQLPALRRRLWPRVQRDLGISFAPLAVTMTDWHRYELHWRPDGCRFLVDDRPVLLTPHTPRGPLGFVCWIDNQYLVATANGRFRWGVLPVPEPQWMAVADLALTTEP